MAKPPLDVIKLRKALLVMLSSDQTGEIMAASALAQKLLKAAGRDIHWLVDQLERTPARKKKPAAAPPWEQSPRWERPPPDPARPLGGWQDMLDICLMQLYGLKLKDQDFVQSLDDQRLRSKYWAPSAKQMEWLVNIYERIIGGHYR